jgi:hypothetical protein
MSITRGPLAIQTHFTTIPNAWLRDPSLSYKAKGVLAAIVSHAVGYELTSQQLIAESSDGKDAVRAAIQELMDAGYLIRTRARSESGRLAGSHYTLVDRTLDGAVPTPPMAESPTSENPSLVGPTSANPPSPMAGRPPLRRTGRRTVSAARPSGRAEDELEGMPELPHPVAASVEPGAESVGKIANRLATEYVNLVPLSKHQAIAALARKALGSGYDEPAVSVALRALAVARRAVTTDSLRIELDEATRPLGPCEVPPGTSPADEWRYTAL